MKGPLLLRFAGLGDAMFVNTIAFHYAREKSCRVYVGSNYPQLFKNTPNVICLPTKSQRIAHQIGNFMKRSGIIDSMIYMGYQIDGPGAKMKPMDNHILSVLANKVGLASAPTRPMLFLSSSELKSAALPQTGKPWIAMHSTGVTEMTENKNWFPGRFNQVARKLRHKYRVVQLGLTTDPLLDSDLDLRGKINPRQAAATIASCSALICQEGYLMHAATAVGTPVVAIFGGFIAPEESGYNCNINLFTKLPCSPCWLRTKCPYEKECMRAISAQDVLNALDKLLSKELVRN